MPSCSNRPLSCGGTLTRERQPPQASVRALVSNRFTITACTFPTATHCLHVKKKKTLNAPTVWPSLHIGWTGAQRWCLQLDEDQHRPAPAPRFRQTLQRALANGKKTASAVDKYGQSVFKSASAFPAIMDGECEAKQLLLKPGLVYLEKSRMCHNKYTLHCVF